MVFATLSAGCDAPTQSPPVGSEDIAYWSDTASVDAEMRGSFNEGTEGVGAEPGRLSSDESCLGESPYASELIAFAPGADAGFGQDKMPDIVLGPPAGNGQGSGALDVVSLGVGGTIIVGFGDRTLMDGPGPDLVVWENAFAIQGNPDTPYAELGEVSVSSDGETWHTFSCDVTVSDGFDQGCAGWRIREDFAPCALLPLDPTLTGGDTFDFADLGVDAIRFVRITDLATGGGPPSAGFDLDAVGGVHIAK